MHDGKQLGRGSHGELQGRWRGKRDRGCGRHSSQVFGHLGGALGVAFWVQAIGWRRAMDVSEEDL